MEYYSTMYPPLLMLQWVHGRRTVVMAFGALTLVPQIVGFNGSTVGEPWLCRALPTS